MPSTSDLRVEIRRLATQQLDLINDGRPWSEKQAEWEGRQQEITAKSHSYQVLSATDFDTDAAGSDAGAATEIKSVPLPARSLGDHVVQHGLIQKMADAAGARFAVDVPEWTGKAATDAQVTTGLVFPQIDTTVVEVPRQPFTVVDLLDSGNLSAPSLTYYVQGATEGVPTAVAELGKKPQIHYTWTTVNDVATKIAAFTKVSDESREDIPFIVSVINGTLVLDLRTEEERQVLKGSGTAPELRGLLNRSGIQTETRGVAASDPMAEPIFRAMTKVNLATYLQADGIIMNALDYQTLRLAKDLNNQYYGGGYFLGAYGVDGIPTMPNVWGLRTVVTSQMPQGQALVGNFKAAATLYRKGGIRVDATNTNEDDFIYNRSTIRAEERVLLAVRRPTALVKVNLVGT